MASSSIDAISCSCNHRKCNYQSFEARPAGSRLRMRTVGAHLPHPEVRAQRASKDAPQDEAGQIVMKAEMLELETFLPYRLYRLADAVSREFSTIYSDRFGLTRPEWRTLAGLGQHGTTTATALGEQSAMHKTKVSRAVAA